MANYDLIEMEGTVIDILPGMKFKIEVIPDGENMKPFTTICHLTGKIHMNKIRVTVGDRVTVQVSPYDLSRGRIVWRGK